MPNLSPTPNETIQANGSKKPFLLSGIRIHLLWVAWASVTTTGFLLSVDQESRPSRRGSTPERWPESVALKAPTERPKLLMFLHSRCSCARASLAELKNLLSQFPGSTEAQVLFFVHPELAQSAQQGELWTLATQIEGVSVRCDDDGEITRQFGARASGSVVLYDKYGRLRFTGGITAARGHVGSNPGSMAIAAFLAGETPKDRIHSVFGCPILTRTDGGEGSVR